METNIFCELPSYLGPLVHSILTVVQALVFLQDEQGMSAVELEKTLAEMKAKR